MGENSLCSLFTHLYHLSTSKNCAITDLLVGSENLVSLYFGFRCNLTSREMIEVASLLSLLEGCFSREGRSDARVWNPNPNRGYTYKSLFSLLLDSPKESVFYVVWRIKVPKKVRFFIWQVLLGRVNTINKLVRRRTSLLGPFCCMLFHFVACFFKRQRKILIIIFGIASILELCGALSSIVQY